ncbi:hypothetical protein, partial [Alistipes putredinis]|uniref:hypothetical protein n=1 Tax=Alistipes putredinis TaxID=28117 RepID=UPI003AB6E5E9
FCPDKQQQILFLSIRYFKNSYSYQFLQILSHIFSNTSKKYVVKRILTVQWRKFGAENKSGLKKRFIPNSARFSLS